MNLKHNSKSGFTLIELLVVMLILVILTVVALPAIREYLVRARYTADVDPAIGNIRTKVELYRYEQDHLPGMELAKGTSGLKADDNEYTKEPNDSNATGKVIKSLEAPDIDGACYIHTMSYSEVDPDNSGLPAYMSGEWAGTPHAEDGTVAWGESFIKGEDPPIEANADWAGVHKFESWHAFKQIGVTFNDLRGRFVAPYNFQYAVIFNRGEDYCWVVGALGTGGGLPVGTGYAVLEYNNTALKTKFIATFERYKAESTRKPLTLWSDVFEGSEDHQISANPLAEREYVIIEGAKETFPTYAELKAAGDVAEGAFDLKVQALDTFKDNLLKAGWKIE